MQIKSLQRNRFHFFLEGSAPPHHNGFPPSDEQHQRPPPQQYGNAEGGRRYPPRDVREPREQGAPPGSAAAEVNDWRSRDREAPVGSAGGGFGGPPRDRGTPGRGGPGQMRGGRGGGGGGFRGGGREGGGGRPQYGDRESYDTDRGAGSGSGAADSAGSWRTAGAAGIQSVLNVFDCCLLPLYFPTEWC